MKITINFNEEEKRTMIRDMMTATNKKEYIDRDEHIVGNFGEIKYDYKKQEIVFDLKTGFIKATSQLMVGAVNLVKSFTSTCMMFTSCWFEDVKDLNKKEENHTDEKSE